MMDYTFLFNSILLFVTLLYGKLSFSRKLVDMVINFIISFITKKFCKSLEDSIIIIIDKAEDEHEIKVKVRDCIQ